PRARRRRARRAGQPRRLQRRLTGTLSGERDGMSRDTSQDMSQDMRQDMRQMTGLGRSIEDSSFAIIDAEAGAHEFDARAWQVVRRVIHATADFEFKTLMRLSPDAVASGIAALVRGCPVGC